MKVQYTSLNQLIVPKNTHMIQANPFNITQSFFLSVWLSLALIPQTQLSVPLCLSSPVCQFILVMELLLEASQVYMSLDETPFCCEKT